MKQRVHWLDIAKGILILLLLVHHFPTATRNLYINNLDFSFVYCWQAVYASFFMQAFFFISGYCASFTISTHAFTKKLLKQLVIPFCFFEFLICSIHCMESDELAIRNIINYWYNSGGTHLWYLNALIFSKVVIWGIIKLSKYCSWNRMITMTTLFVISVSFFCVGIFLQQYDIGSNFFCIRNACASLFFVVIGYYCKEHYECFKKMQIMGYFYPYLLLFLLLFNLPIPIMTASIGFGLKGLPVFIFTSLSGTMALFLLCQLINSNSILEFFGRNSLIVYCTHFYPLSLTINYLSQVMSLDTIVQRLFFVLLVYFIELCFMIAFVRVFNIKPLNYIVGKY